MVNKSRVLEFLREHRLAVQATASPEGVPQAAVVGYAVSDRLELIFDTLASTRKAHNLRGNPRVAFVVGGLKKGDERTVQYEGVADEPSGAELNALKRLYFERFPDGRERQTWPGLTYFRARPTWIRFSDYIVTPPAIVEFDAAQLRSLA